MAYTNQQSLLQGLQKGETAAFEYLHQKSFRAVLTLTKDSPCSWEDAEDLYSEGIIVLLNKINTPNFVLEVNLQALLYSICKNKNGNILDKEQNKQIYLNDHSNDIYEEKFDHKMDRSLHSNILWNNLKKLKQDCQKIIKKYLEEYGSKEIAEYMGFTTMYARKKISLCLKALDNHVKKDYYYLRLKNNDEIDLT